MLVRGEHRVEGRTGAPPDAAVDLVRGYLRTARVGAVARLRTRRRRVELVDLDGKPQAEVVDDEVSVLDGRRVTRRGSGSSRSSSSRAPRRASPTGSSRGCARPAPGDPDPTPKIVRALGPRALAPPDVVPPGP